MSNNFVLTSRTHPSVNLRITSNPSSTSSRKQTTKSTHPYPASRQTSTLSTASATSTLSQASTRCGSDSPALELDTMHTTPRAYHAPAVDMTRGDSYQQQVENRDLNKHLSRQCREVKKEKEDKEGLRTKGMKWACHVMRV